jgi:hypothetical protein
VNFHYWAFIPCTSKRAHQRRSQRRLYLLRCTGVLPTMLHKYHVGSRSSSDNIMLYLVVLHQTQGIICQSTLVYFIHITITEGVVVIVAEGYYFTIVVLITKSIVDRWARMNVYRTPILTTKYRVNYSNSSHLYNLVHGRFWRRYGICSSSPPTAPLIVHQSY